MYIREFPKIFNKDKAIDFFNKTFKNFINDWKQKNKITVSDEKDSIFKILHWYWEKFKNKTIVNNEIKYFWPFIKNVSSILLNMSMRLNRIDICLYANKCIAKLNNNEERIKDYKLIQINSINSDLITLGGQDLSLFVLKLFDDKYKKLSLISRCSYGTYLEDYENKKEIICKTNPEVVEAIDWLNLFIIEMKNIVKEYKLNTLNFVKHNILDINPKPIEWQEIFNIWYVNEKFIRPMLKLLFRYQEENGKEYILGRYIEHNDNLFSIYELIYNCPDDIKFEHKFNLSH